MLGAFLRHSPSTSHSLAFLAGSSVRNATSLALLRHSLAYTRIRRAGQRTSGHASWQADFQFLLSEEYDIGALQRPIHARPILSAVFPMLPSKQDQCWTGGTQIYPALRGWNVSHSILCSSFLQPINAVMLWPVHVQTGQSWRN